MQTKKSKKELKTKVSTQAEMLETALDYIEKLQKDKRDLEAELDDCQEESANLRYWNEP